MKIFAVCQSGLGTSFMVQMNIESALQELGVDVQLSIQIQEVLVETWLITSLLKRLWFLLYLTYQRKRLFR